MRTEVVAELDCEIGDLAFDLTLIEKDCSRGAALIAGSDG